jgi:hypothetical protein
MKFSLKMKNRSITKFSGNFIINKGVGVHERTLSSKLNVFRLGNFLRNLVSPKQYFRL